MLHSGIGFTKIPVVRQPLSTKTGNLVLNFDLLLFSGEKDDEGNEVYAEDILVMSSKEHTLYGRVFCDSLAEGFWVEYTTIDGDKGHAMPLWAWLDSQDKEWSNGIVVGNSYETPELLDE